MSSSSRHPSPFGFAFIATLLAATAVVVGSCKPLTVDEVLLVPKTFSAVGSASLSGTVGATISSPGQIRVLDQNGDPMEGRSVAFTANGGSVTPSSATTNAQGMAQATSWTLPTVAGTATLTASLSGANLPAVPFTASVSPGPATAVILAPGTPSSNNQTGTAGSNVAVAPSVRVNDSFGNAVSGVTVTFTVLTGGGKVNNSTTATTASSATNTSGIASMPWSMGQTAGANTLTAASTGLTGSPVTFTATGAAGPAASIVIASGAPTSQGQTAEANTKAAVAPSVRVADQFSNVASAVTVRFTVSAGAGKVFANAADATGATSQDVTTNSSGIATIFGWQLGVVGANALSVTVPSVTSVPAFAITATGITGVPTQIAIVTETPSSNNQTAAVSGNVAVAPGVVVRSAAGNPVPSVSVTFTVGSGAGTIVLTAGGASVTSGAITTDANGIARLASWRVGASAGTNTLTAASTGLTGSPVSFTATAVVTPSAPTSLLATAVSTTQINLSWLDNANNEDGFRIERCTGTSCTSFLEIATVAANIVTYQSTGLTAGTAYSYRVRAYNAGGNSSYTSTASATTTPSAPTSPSSLSATSFSTTQIDLNWTDNANNEDGFRIERCTGTSCTIFSEIATVGLNVATYQNTGLSATTSYSYRVRAYNAGGNSSYSNTASATPFDPCTTGATTFTVPNSTSGSLATTDCILGSVYADIWRQTVSSGTQQMAVTYGSSVFHPELRSYLYGGAPGTSGWWFANLTTTGTLTSYYVLGPGTYDFGLTSRLTFNTGAYTFQTTLNPAMPTGSCPGFLVSKNITVTHAFSTTDCVHVLNGGSTNRSSRIYNIWLAANQTLTVRMNAVTVSDPYLEAYDISGTRTFITFNDDGGGGLNSLMTISSTSVSRYIEIRATHLGSPNSNSYTFIIDP